jgi:hypothetical protein
LAGLRQRGDPNALLKEKLAMQKEGLPKAERGGANALDKQGVADLNFDFERYLVWMRDG